jgi:hypothetical protein
MVINYGTILNGGLEMIRFAIVISSVLLSGCAARGFVLMTQVGVIANIQNNCAPLVSITSMYGEVVPALPYGKDKTVAIETRPFSGQQREIWIRINAYADQNKTQYIGSKTITESISTYYGSRDRSYSVDDLDSPPGAQCKPSP